MTAALLGATLPAMPHTSPRLRALRFLEWLARQDSVIQNISNKTYLEGWRLTFHGVPVVWDTAVDKLAEIIAEAQDEIREGFLRPPRDPDHVMKVNDE